MDDKQDVAYLLGLPIVGEAVGPRVVAASWKDDLEARFALVDRVDSLEGQHQLADRIQGWYRGHRYRPT